MDEEVGRSHKVDYYFEAVERLRSITLPVATPLYVFLPDILSHRIEDVLQATAAGSIFYSLKANPSLPVLRKIAVRGLGADVSTEWELGRALEAGFSPSSITCVGPWKSDRFLRKLIDIGVRRISVESKSEVDRIRQIGGRDVPVQIYVRWLPAISGQTVLENMAASVSHFGLLTEEIAELQCGDVPHGVHTFVGSDFQTVDQAVEVIKLLEASAFCSLPHQFGPGLGISYVPGRPDPSWSGIVSSLNQLRPTNHTTDFEIGRYLVAHCIVILCKVLLMKSRAGVQVCVVDAGMAHFARTILTGARHVVVNLSAHRPMTDLPDSSIKIVGPSCTPLDVLGSQCYFSEVNPGDTLAILACGAYGQNLALHGFMGLESAAMVNIDELLP